MKVTLPKTIALSGKDKESVKLTFTGHVTLPDEWNGGDFEDFYKASLPDDKSTVWERQWKWAKAHIVEWAIKDLPTNPNQIKDNDDLTWPLMSFLSSSVIAGMNDYMKEGVEEIKELVDFPVPDDLRPGEFLTWHKAMKDADDDDMSNLLKSWLAGKVLVRGWPEGKEPKNDRSVDLRLMMAVDELLSETILPSLNLGNWSAPLGEA
jgi:hypothetical protein